MIIQEIHKYQGFTETEIHTEQNTVDSDTGQRKVVLVKSQNSIHS